MMDEFTEEERIRRRRAVRAHQLGHEVLEKNMQTDKEIEEVLTEGGEMNPREIFISRLMQSVQLYASLRVLASSTTSEKGREAMNSDADELLEETEELVRRYTKS
tara:strand:- start:257 stop:571 length:315 start_codon:yes stop_codon:yes gene_type:complete